MIRLSLLILALSFVTFAKAQLVVNDKMNIVYAGIDNPLSIAMFNFDCEDIILKTDIGTLTKTECGKYTFFVSETGIVDFKVFSVKDGIEKELSTLKYRIKELPVPVCSSQKTKSEFSVVELRKRNALDSIIIGYNYSDSFDIIKFDYLFVRDTIFISSGTIDGAIFSKKLKEQILHLLPGDWIFFENIIVQDKNGEVKKLNPNILKLVI